MSEIILGIDTSCDETSAAVLKDGKTVLANVISSQIKLHAPYGGVVPELASRAHLERMPTVVNEALKKAGVGLNDLTGIAITTSPGLIGCLLVGLSYAKSLAYSLKIPIVSVHHLKAHLFSPFLENEEAYPFLGLVVSGGHTALYRVDSFDEITCLGHTVDDAAGEAFDKVAKLMGLGYPGGPRIDRLAKLGNPNAFSFTRARVKKGQFYFSFSGLKTAVSVLIRKQRPDLLEKEASETDPFVLDLVASFQKEVVEALLEKVELACKLSPVKGVFVSGGVAVNSGLRAGLKAFTERTGIPHGIPSPLVCTDNGAMIAYVGAKELQNGKKSHLDLNAFASAPMW